MKTKTKTVQVHQWIFRKKPQGQDLLKTLRLAKAWATSQGLSPMMTDEVIIPGERELVIRFVKSEAA